MIIEAIEIMKKPNEWCSISKRLDKNCWNAFPIWNKFDDARMMTGTSFSDFTLSELKSLLRDAITELEPWGEK